ncbi:pentatricopeptide repeat-containing protein At5g56310-like [Selaginella moellendorffii]|uniref:pentatricopeptide repeat-containing protein At5g56310-like n=1 Tax=Selaginella moellendorffii TaxID=88036 RepID=UPI000D1CBA30|nr:pentatricopeptide repeat-containing protein At5g56310-like [Selaginella moellendorffii]|eukprot:XP_024544792.1 pentatricopeptide repeat-containing protein At5g56310-like [Selaginella moellendorffii]
MPEHNLVSWNVMLCCYGQHGHVGQAKRMFSVLQELEQCDLVSCNSMLSAYASCGELEQAQLMFDSMQERDLFSWNILLSAYAAAGRTVQARQVFGCMPERAVVSWNAVLAAYAQRGTAGSASEALEVLHGMLLVEMPDEVTLVCALLACSRLGQLATGLHLFRSMASDLQLLHATQKHYGCMVDVLSRAGHAEAARDLVAAMPFVPTAQDWRCLLMNSSSGSKLAASRVFALEPKDCAGYVLLANTWSMPQAGALVSTVGICQGASSAT